MLSYWWLFIYGYTIQENGVIDPKKHSTEILIFIVLGIMAVLLAGIDAAGARDNSRK